ncbi:MAG: UDP-3-O-(3-hydroxymyristoyl)glucosamine N-acyltransferase [Cytophagales bacterium]|nr:UDP-3-O-(3-hydroxymyristoyl)glucosamine N-acyltransferase [Bernardetiaceae bacterium]MDW8209988.1 UDP-3-O-(3-hydroxymyristoyl)glucosamine N-acyltransferase [Cytophagales bacterium]
MEFTVQQVAALLNGEIEGDSQRLIKGLAKIQEASPTDIVFLANMLYEPYAYTTQAAAIIVNKDFVPRKKINATLIRVEDAYVAFSKLLGEYNKLTQSSEVKAGIEQPCYIAASASIGENVYIGAFAYIGQNVKIGDNTKVYPHVYIGDNTTIGNNTTIYAGVKIYHNCVIGNNCTIHAGAVIGSDGFGFAPQADGTYIAVPQVGNVVIEDNVDIGANTTIDRATMGETLIQCGVKLDNLIQVAHNVKIGKNTVIAALTGISGSTEIGNNCVIAGQVGFAGHLKVANRTTIGAQAGVIKSIKEENQTLIGSPVLDIKDFMRSFAIFKRLPEIAKRLDALEKIIANNSKQ